jgi:AmmeMemoRadiSam system protein B
VLHNYIQSMLSKATLKTQTPKAVIVPHAGYIYSGPVAASAYAQLAPLRDRIRRVILLGPCHRVPLRGLAATRADYFETPLGSVEIDREAIDRIISLPQVQMFDSTHAQEHSLEVQLPFLQEVLADFTLVPLVVGDADAEEVDEVLEMLWGGDETLFVISSDLSHYHDYRSARELDSRTCHAIEQLDGNSIQYGDACGRNPVIGLLLAARKHHLKAITLDLRNSGDTAGDRSRVVGYGAWAFE